jgi:hypothetical protein
MGHDNRALARELLGFILALAALVLALAIGGALQEF